MKIEDHLSKALMIPTYLAHSAWIRHIPLAFFIISYFKPKIFVELGVFHGVSFISFCQAIKEQGVQCKAYGIDTWLGDEHAGLIEDGVFEKLQHLVKKDYGNYAELIKTTFDESADRFENGSIDLLHIDGFHSYEIVKHDFDTWLPKMSENGVVIFHDIAGTGVIDKDLFEEECLDFDNILLRVTQKGYVTDDHYVNSNFTGLDVEFRKLFPKYSDIQFNKIHNILQQLLLERSWGVWKLWNELKEKYPNITFKHGYGLGVLFVGQSFKHNQQIVSIINAHPFYDLFFKRLGYLVEAESKLKTQLQNTQAQLESTQAQLESTQARLESTQARLESTQAQLAVIKSSDYYKISQWLRSRRLLMWIYGFLRKFLFILRKP